MATPAQIAANQVNSRESIGPTSPQGCAKSSINALKHGNRSRKLALLREESLAFEERLRKWMAIGDAQNDMEEHLTYHNVRLSFELDRAERALAERCRGLIENSDEDEIAEAESVGKQLFFDPAGPATVYGNPPGFQREKKTSWNGQAVDPNDPALLVRILERNAAGCFWLREQWEALRAQLDSTGFWQSHDRLKATRLLGRQPVEANDDQRVATIFVASHALWPAGKTEFDDLLSDMERAQCERYRKAVRERWPDLFRSRGKEEWKKLLIALADQNIERLNVKLEVHEENAGAHAERTIARLSFDPCPEGEALREHMVKCTSALFRGMANYRKHQARTSGRCEGPSGVGGHGAQPDSPEYRGREVREGDGSELWADSSLGSGDGLDDRLEPANVIDPDGLEWQEDELNGAGEISENATNEANFDESTSIVETQDLIHVTANSAALSGLDNGAAEPREDSGAELSGTAEIGENAPNEANFDDTMGIVETQESIHVTANSAALSGLDNGAAEPEEDRTREHGEAGGMKSPPRRTETGAGSVAALLRGASRVLFSPCEGGVRGGDERALGNPRMLERAATGPPPLAPPSQGGEKRGTNLEGTGKPLASPCSSRHREDPHQNPQAAMPNR